MTDIDLIKQALEYLEDNQHHIVDHERHAYLMLYNDCITALKERLAQDKAIQALHNENERLGLYKDAYAQPEQEPPKYSFKAHWEKDGRIGVVGAIVRPDGGVHLLQDFIDPPKPEQKMVMWPCLIDTADFSKGTVTVVMQCEDYKVSAGTHWLSTTPPQRTEQNFCSRCGKRTPDLITIHTCTPPKD